MRALALTMMLLPSVAFAQVAPTPPPPPPAPVVPAPIAPAPTAADQGECTVTTTVRCTGNAAPYAVQAAQPQAPVIIEQPAPPPPAPPAAPQMMAPPPGAVILDPRALGDGWRIVQSGDGSLWKERKVSTDAPAVWGTGLAFWLGGYAAAIIGGMQQGDMYMIGWMPMIGAMVNIAFSEDGNSKGLWAVDAIAQTGGFVMFLVGIAAGPDKVQRLPLTVGPASFVGGGSGLALAGHF